MLGFKRVPQEQRWIVERFGKYSRTLGPGLRWVWPFVEKVRTFVSVWEQRYPLFEGAVKIDFLDGSAAPKNAFAYVQCKSEKEDPGAPSKMAYSVKNIREATVALIENAVRSYLNTKTVGRGLEEGRTGNLLDNMGEEDINKIRDGLGNWGLKLNRVTIGDFDLDKTIIAAREIVVKAESSLRAAQHEKERRAEETMGTLIEMLRIAEGVQPQTIKREIRRSPELKARFVQISEDLIHRRMAIDGKSFIDIRVSGAEGTEKALLDLIAVWRKTAPLEKEAKTKETSSGEKG